MNTATHFLSKDCFVCRMGNYWIILCTGRDRYLCVEHKDLASIGSQLSGWSERNLFENKPSSSSTEANAVIQSLTSNGIITENSLLGKSFIESVALIPDGQLDARESTLSERIPLHLAVRFFVACGTVDLRLRTRSFERNLAKILRRRRRAESANTICDSARAVRLISIFRTLRPLYPRSYLCLFDSLALIEFLAGCRLFPQVVFGVVADPFQAHCWVQEGTTVLNDDLERVRRYRPIMSA
jgi:transglutaminase superfamily protein